MADVLLSSPTKNAIQKELASQLLSTAGVGDPISFDDVDGIPNLPGTLVIDRVDATGEATPTKREYIEYSGTSGTTVLIKTRNVDGSASALTHAIGSIVEWTPDITWATRMYTALSQVVEITDVTSINSSLVTTTGTSTLTNKILSGASLAGSSINSATIAGATLSGVIAGNATLPGNLIFAGDVSLKRRKTPVYDNGNAGASLAVDMDNGETQKVTLTETMATLSLVNMEEGDYLTLYSLQDATGTRLVTFAQSGGTCAYPAGASLPTLTATASARDVLGIRGFNASISDILASSLALT